MSGPSKTVAWTVGGVVALGAAACVALGAGWTWKAAALPEGLVSGVTVDGMVPLPGIGASELRALVAARAQDRLQRRVRVVGADAPDVPLLEASLGELGVSLDSDGAVERALSVGHRGNLVSRFRAVKAARERGVDVPIAVRVDASTLFQKLGALKERVETPPVPARLDLDRRTVVAERLGVAFDSFAALADVERIAQGANGDRIVLPVLRTKPEVTKEMLAKLDVHAVLGSYETRFSRRGDQQLRGRNIEVAAARLEGVVLMPGETFSFNRAVGERSENTGFQKSWEILKGEMTEGVGGGTCQVASTFHGAAFFAGLEIQSRAPHSRPSAYIPMGLDATVVYPTVDLKVKNPFPFPVVIHTQVGANTLRFELLGAEKPVHVAFRREIVEYFPYGRRIERSSELRGRNVNLKQHGIRGYRITRTRTLRYASGRVREEVTENVYPPTTEIYEVPRGFDVALLPPLPFAPSPAVDPTAPGGDANGEGAAVAANGAAGRAFAPAVLTATAESGMAGGSLFAGFAPGIASTADLPLPGAAVPEGPPPDDPEEKMRQLRSKGIRVTEPPGTHAPSRAQANPDKTLEIRR
jgi:vancomycin resistance protein YoaR